MSDERFRFYKAERVERVGASILASALADQCGITTKVAKNVLDALAKTAVT